MMGLPLALPPTPTPCFLPSLLPNTKAPPIPTQKNNLCIDAEPTIDISQWRQFIKLGRNLFWAVE